MIESKILNAQAEVESAKLMRQTADILSGKAAMQIRYLEALKGIASNTGVKVVFIAEEEWLAESILSLFCIIIPLNYESIHSIQTQQWAKISNGWVMKQVWSMGHRLPVGILKLVFLLQASSIRKHSISCKLPGIVWIRLWVMRRQGKIQSRIR